MPLGAALAFAAGLGVYGVWWGLVSGLSVAAAVSLSLLWRIDWKKEAVLAKRRLVGGGDHPSFSRQLNALDDEKEESMLVSEREPETLAYEMVASDEHCDK